MNAKRLWFSVRDGVRFKTAKVKYDFDPEGNIDEFDFRSMKHIVILKLDGKLGDTEVMSHFYHTLYTLQPRPFLSVICPKNLADVYANVFHFDQVLISHPKPNFRDIRALCDELLSNYLIEREEEIEPTVDLVVTTEPHFRPRDFLFNSLLQPKFVAGCETHVKSVNLHLYDPDGESPKVSECFYDLMCKGHLTPELPISYVPFVTEESLRRIRLHMGANHNKRVFIGINPLASSRSRSFTKAVTVRLIEHILEEYSDKFGDRELFIMLLCPPDAIEFKHYINVQCDVSHLLQLPPHSSVIDYASAINELTALVTVDTAAVHLCCASQRPQICFYKGESLAEANRWAPIGDNVTIIRRDGIDVENLEPELILGKTREFLNSVVKKEQEDQDNR